MGNVRVEKASSEHIPLLIGGMSPLIKEEILKSVPGDTLESIMADSIAVSEEAWTYFVDDQIVCMFGVRTPNLLSNHGVPWLIPHLNVNKYKWVFLKSCRAGLLSMSDRYEHFGSMVIAKNKRAIKWLKWLGFTIYPAVNHKGTEFHPYVLSRK